MSRSVTFLLVVLAILAGLLLADPMGFFAGGVERTEEAADEGTDLREGPTLEGRPDAAALTGEERWVDGEPVRVLDLGLGTSGLQGTVTGEGAPLFAARVWVVLAPPNGGRAVRTAKDGTWEIRGLPPGTHDVRATAPDFLGRTTTAPAVAEGETADVETIELGRVRALTDGIRVRVTDDAGRPIQGAKVLATTMMWSLHLAIGPELAGEPGVIHRSALTNDRGEAAILGLPPEKYDVVVVAKGFQATFQPMVVVAAGRVRRLAFRLLPGASISGTVVDAEGHPVGEAFVTGLHMPTFAGSLTTMTAADGTFVLDGLREGKYWVISGHEEKGEAQANPVTSPSRGLRMTLGGMGHVVLKVTRPGGEPVTRYQVRPYREEPFGYVYSLSYAVEDEGGRYEAFLSPGTWHFAVKAPDGDFSAEAHTTVRLGEKSEVTAVLPAGGVVRGVVADADGNHVAGAEVYVRRGGFPPTPVREQYARTDADGAFEVLGLPLEQVNLHVVHERYAPAVIEVLPAPRESASETTVRLSSGASIVGHVRRGGTEPVAREQVNLWQGFPLDARTTVTAEDGSFRFDAITAGTYSLSTGPLENQSRGVVRSGIQVPEAGEVTVDFDLGAAEGGGVLTGRVEQGGRPVPRAAVTVVDQRGLEHLISVATDAEGKFRAEGIVPGGVTVSVSSEDGLYATRRTTVPEEGEGGPLVVEFGTASLRGRLVTEEGAPVSGAWIQVESVITDPDFPYSSVRANLTSDQDGIFQTAGLEPGSYQVRVSGTGFAGLLTAPFDLEGEAIVDLGNLRLAPGAAVQGRVVDDAGTPIEDVTISLEDRAGRPVFLFSLVTTGSDGRYRVAGLEAGAYVIRFEVDGYAPASRDVDVGAGGATVDVALARGGTVEVLVLDGAGNPVAGARVRLRDAAGNLVQRTLSIANLFSSSAGTTDDRGVGRIPDLAPATYTVTATKDGWQQIEEGVPAVVPAGGTTTVTVTLLPAD
ncbi:MAG: carboxypeptidase regulatory-like domain-containing protein [Planctomycetota bacterium]|jgi:protocatechuate 3,4-dioxygenase beta subunit